MREPAILLNIRMMTSTDLQGSTSSTLRVKHLQNAKNKTYGRDRQYRWQSTGNYDTLSFTRRCKFLKGLLGQSHNSFLYPSDPCCSLRTEMAAEEIITDKTIGHVYQNYATSRPWTDLRAHEIQRELKQVRWVTSQTYFSQFFYPTCSTLRDQTFT